jgi:hypothetical protein
MANVVVDVFLGHGGGRDIDVARWSGVVCLWHGWRGPDIHLQLVGPHLEGKLCLDPCGVRRQERGSGSRRCPNNLGTCMGSPDVSTFATPSPMHRLHAISFPHSWRRGLQLSSFNGFHPMGRNPFQYKKLIQTETILCNSSCGERTVRPLLVRLLLVEESNSQGGMEWEVVEPKAVRPTRGGGKLVSAVAH